MSRFLARSLGFKKVENCKAIQNHAWENAIPYESIPGPRKWPVIGNLWRFLPFMVGIFGKNPHSLHKSIKEEYGDIVIFKGVGKKPVVVLYNPKDMENVLRSCAPLPHRHILDGYVNYRTHLRKDIFQGVGGILSVQGEEWYKIRSLVNSILMQPKIVEQYVEKTNQVAVKLVENMRFFRARNEKHEMPDDFLTELYKWALESIAVIAFDRDLGCLDLNLPKNSKPYKLVEAAINVFDKGYYLELFPHLWQGFPNPIHQSFVESLDYITSVSCEYTDEALEDATSSNKSGALGQLAASCDKGLVYSMVTDMLVAGPETTGKTLASLLYYLARNPEVQARLREEILVNLPEKTSPVTKEVLKKTPYLRAAIKETLRVAPVIVGTMRTLTENLVIGGYQFPKGLHVASMHFFPSNDDQLVKDPEKFVPERWLRSTGDEYSFKNVHAFAYMPFGFGTRSCVGKRFANLELEVATARIIRNFKLSWNYKDMRFVGKMFYGPSDPLRISIEETDN